MAQFPRDPNRERVTPNPLARSMPGYVEPTGEIGMVAMNSQVFSLVTLVLGCVFAGFLINPFISLGLPVGPGSGLLSVVAFIGGLILFFGSRFALNRADAHLCSLFRSYGAFLIILGALIAPTFGVPGVLGPQILRAIGILFLIWTVFLAMFIVSALKTAPIRLATLALLFLASLAITIGTMANVPVLNIIGGWLAILSGIVGWYMTLSQLQESGTHAFSLPQGDYSSAD
jgi:succinate-acetate transporter protein